MGRKRQYTTLTTDRIMSSAAASCGTVAALIYTLSWIAADSFGRLGASTEAISDWADPYRFTVSEIEDACRKLAERRLWHLYTVDGTDYAEILRFDDAQQPVFLARRSLAGHLPDPPDKPSLAAAKRKHSPVSDTRRQGGRQILPTPPSTLPQEEADLSLAVSVGAQQLAKCHEQYLGRLINSSDHTALSDIVQTAEKAGVNWQTLLQVMKRCQDNYRGSEANQKISSIGYYIAAFKKELLEIERSKRAESDQRIAARGLGVASPAQVLTPPQEDPREAIRRMRELAST